MRRLTLLLTCALILTAGAAFANDADIALENATLSDGGSRIEASLRLTGCDAGAIGETTVAITHEGRILAQQTFDIASIYGERPVPDEFDGDPCANTTNDKCDTQTCPDAIINGRVRKGTCEPSIVLCVCDYGVVGIDMHLAAADLPPQARLEVVVDPENRIAEVSEDNNRQTLTR